MIFPEQIELWLDKGKTPQAIAAYGISSEGFYQVVETNRIPEVRRSGRPLLPWQVDLIQGGKFLYYTFPLIESMTAIRPKTAQRIINHCEDQGALEDLSEGSMPDKLRWYAFADSLATCFNTRTGLWWDAKYIANTAPMLFPELTAYSQEIERVGRVFTDTSLLDPWNVDEKKEHDGLSQLDLSLKQLKEIFTRCLRRRGVIIYYNEQLLNHQVLTGVEAENEMMIVSKRPIDTSAISGVEILSEDDKEVLRKQFHS